MATSPVPDMAAPPGMCPGVAVLGGGGAGGDGEGSGSGGKDGSGGGAGGDGENGNGDGKGAGGCGKGSNGGCTNCKSKIGKGDPVDVLTGEVYTTPETDLFLPGWFNLEIIRSYSSARNLVEVGLGFGWTHSLAWSLEERRHEFLLRTGNGATETLPALREVGQQASVGPWGIMRTESGYAVRPGNEFIHHFAKTQPGASVYRLVGVSYRARGRIVLGYEGDRLAHVTDTAGRRILFRGARDGRIGAIHVPAPDGQTITFARFEYDGRGDLVASVDADGYSTHYAYDEEHRLQRLEYPSGIAFRFVYDQAGRCIETWGEYPGRADVALAAEVPSVLRDGRPAKGIYHCRFAYNDDYTEVVDSVRLQRFFRGPADQIAKAVSARGGVTTRTFDERARVTSLTDPSDATWTWQYDDMDEVVVEAGADGEKIGVGRDGLGREMEVVDPAGGKTTIQRDEDGEMLSLRDQKGGTVHFLQLNRGVAREVVDERGGRHLFEHDVHGNCVARTFPNGARYEFGYDYWGRLLRLRNPLGHEISLRYDNRGLRAQMTDQVGRTTAYRYDPMRNLVSTTAPDGSTTAYERGGFNWLTRIVNPDGTELRGLYNREGWLVSIVNELGEMSTRSYFADGNLRSETRFHGASIQYQRDLLGRIIGYDEGDGVHELKVSPSGQLLEHVASDDTSLRYEYDARGELTLAASADVELAFEPDVTGRIAKESVTVEGRTYVVWSGRDEAGDRRSVRTSLGHELAVARDALGRVAELADRDGRVLSMVRSPVGSVQRIELPGGAAIVDTRDAANRLRRRLVAKADDGPPAPGPDWVGGTRPSAVDRHYEYTAVDELYSVSTSTGETDVFEYDVRNRLVRRHDNRGRREDFHVDPCSNYTEVDAGGPQRTYAPGNLLTTWKNNEYRYDAKGYLVEKTVRPEAGGELEKWRYAWDAFGLLQSVERPDGLRVEFKYDAFARRVAKRTVRGGKTLARYHYVWDVASLLHEVRVGADGEPESVRTYLFEDPDDVMPLGHRDTSGPGWVYYVEDLIGTPTDLVDGQGRVLGRLLRSTFGEARPSPDSKETTQFRAPGQYADAETGLHYNRFRYYEPEVGRYISPDPIGYWGGFNLFAYGPNPIGWQDLFGLDFAQLTGAPAAFGDFSPSIQNRQTPDGPRQGYPSGGATVSPGLNTAPAGSNPRNNSCGEQRFAQDLLKFGNSKEGQQLPRDQRNYKLSGKQPPCPTCHAAMMRAAANTNSTVSYTWEQPKGKGNSVTYNGNAKGGCNVTGSGVAGKAVVAGYDHEMGPAASPKAPTTQGYYGVQFGQQSDQTYGDVKKW